MGGKLNSATSWANPSQLPAGWTLCIPSAEQHLSATTYLSHCQGLHLLATSGVHDCKPPAGQVSPSHQQINLLELLVDNALQSATHLQKVAQFRGQQHSAILLEDGKNAAHCPFKWQDTSGSRMVLLQGQADWPPRTTSELQDRRNSTLSCLSRSAAPRSERTFCGLSKMLTAACRNSTVRKSRGTSSPACTAHRQKAMAAER